MIPADYQFTCDEEILMKGYRPGQNSMTQDKALQMLRLMLEAAAAIEQDIEDPEQGSPADERLAHFRDTAEWCHRFLNKK